ncbi:hypothetical protein GCM10020295_81450 [Streptomyces cinereospinus]
MTGGGSVINVSSVLGLVSTGLPQAAYASSKAGLLGLTRDLAAQWSGRKNIRVNALAPGYFASEMTARQQAGHIDDIVSRIPIARTGDPPGAGRRRGLPRLRRGRLRHRLDAHRRRRAHGHLTGRGLGE